MLKRNELKKLANKLGWKVKEVEAAVKELYEYGSINECDGFLRICMSARDP